MTEQAKPTPGEWKAHPYSSVVGAGVVSQPDPKENTVIVAMCPGSDRATAEANAALIAGAKITATERDRLKADVAALLADNKDSCAERLAAETERDRLRKVNAELLAKCKKIIAWLERLAMTAEAKAETERRFESVRAARLADAKNYRATAADVHAAIKAAEELG